MYDLSDLIDLFNIDTKDLDPDFLRLSLTHSTVINEQQDDRNVYKRLEYYYNTGSIVYDILLKLFIFDQVSQESSVISKSHSASKNIFINDFISKTKLSDFFNVNNDILNQSVKQHITYQFIGFLYVEGYYHQIEEYFLSIFQTKKIRMNHDYYGLIQEHAQVRKIPLQIKELEPTESVHEQIFRYQLSYSGKSVIGEGKSKREARMNTSRLYYEKYIHNHEDLLNNRYHNRSKGLKKMRLENSMQSSLHKLARQLRLNFSEVVTSFTHTSLANEYDVVENSTMRAIGADIERLYLFDLCFEKYGNQEQIYPLQVVGFIQGQLDIYQEFLEEENLSHLILGAKSIYSSEKSFQRACVDTFRSILFFIFYNYKSVEPMNDFNWIYEKLLDETDLRFIEPVSSLQERLQQFDLQPQYTYTKQEGLFLSKLTIKVANSSFQFSGKGKSKLSARQSASQTALQQIVEKIMPFLLGEKKDDFNINVLEKIFSFQLVDKPARLRQIMVKENYFGIKDALQGDSSTFIKKVSQTLSIIDQFEKDLYAEFVSFLITDRSIFFKKLIDTPFLIETVIVDISHYVKEQTNEPYLLENRWKYLEDQNKKIIEAYISSNGNLIKHITYPSDELQMLAIRNNPNALYFIESPTYEVLTYLLQNDFLARGKKTAILQKVKQSNPDFLINILRRKYEKLIANIEQTNIQPIIRSDHFTFDLHLRSLFKLTRIKKFYVATGFVFSSGFQLIEEELTELIANHGDIKVIAGNLQSYNSNVVMNNMDIKTAKYLNGLMEQGVHVKTFDEQFYHGKLYYLESKTLQIIIIGSTNFSRQAFQKNKEVDTIYFFNKDDSNPFTQLFDTYWNEAEEVPILDLSRFTNMFGFLQEQPIDSYMNTISIQNMERRISEIPDETLQERLSLWLQYNPTKIYDDIEVANEEYIAMEYHDRKMVVLESFYYGNSYFVFYDTSVQEVLDKIEGKTKSEVFESSGMDKRGYHIRELLTLELTIKSYFLGT